MDQRGPRRREPENLVARFAIAGDS